MGKKNPFDFSDLSDLPQDLQDKLKTDALDTAQEYAKVVRMGAEAGYDQLNINQIIAAATRMGMDVPAQTTVRNYLNKAVELKMLTKPTRQTYALAKGKGAIMPEDVGLDNTAEVVTAPVELQAKTDGVVAETISGSDIDPLADL